MSLNLGSREPGPFMVKLETSPCVQMYQDVKKGHFRGIRCNRGRWPQGGEVAQAHPVQAAKGGRPRRLLAGDIAFLVTLVLALGGVFLSGRFAYHQGSLLEGAKANAVALVQWAEAVAAGGPRDANLPLGLCALAPEQMAAAADSLKAGSQPVTWAACREALFGSGGPMFDRVNPFNALNMVTGSKCERKTPSARGVVVLEKGTSSPPGMPPSVVWSVLGDEEPLVRGLMLRVQVCDGGGYPVRLAEITL